MIVRGAADAAETGDHPLEVQTDEQVEAPVDGIQVAFVVRQLLENAAIFSPTGSPISVRLTSEGDHAVIHVIDRGPGIPESERDGVFERFAGWRPIGYEDRPGTGLGLFICRAIARGTRGRRFDRATVPRRVRCSSSGSPARHGWRAPVTTLLICDDHKVLTDALATVVGLDDGPAARCPARPRSRDGDRALGRAPARRGADGHRLQGRHVRHRGDPPDQGDLARRRRS